MDIQRLVIAKPSGNITAIVFDEIVPEQMPYVAAVIQDDYPSVEQVVFVCSANSSVHGRMAGEEFCGNAARSLGYVLADGQSSEKQFTMSGINSPVRVSVTPGYAKLEISTHIKHETVGLNGEPISIVHMEGISHAVLFDDHPLFENFKHQSARLDGKEFVKSILMTLKLTSFPACGLIFADRRCDVTDIVPYVFVHNTGTLYSETACASGSIAVAYALGENAALLQPSGQVLRATYTHVSENVIKAEINGRMQILWDGPANDLGQFYDPIKKIGSGLQ